MTVTEEKKKEIVKDLNKLKEKHSDLLKKPIKGKDAVSKLSSLVKKGAKKKEFEDVIDDIYLQEGTFKLKNSIQEMINAG